ncbi:ImcF-related family protein [Cupriavidus campinensis]
MRKLRLDLLSILLLAALVAGAIVFWGEHVGNDTFERPNAWLWAVALCAIVLAGTAFLHPWRRRAWALRTLIGQLRQRATALAGTTQEGVFGVAPVQAPEPDPFEALRRRLRGEHGFGWRLRCRRRWILLTGDDDAIGRLLPPVAKQGWLMTPDAVLLWHKHDNADDGHRAVFWLTRLRKLRPARPVDAVVVVIDGTGGPDAPCTGSGKNRISPAHIAELLRWSAPVYLLEAGLNAATADDNTAVIGCELPSHADAATIEPMLLELRNRLSLRGVAQLAERRSNRYMAALSQRLDTRASHLAAYAARLATGHRARGSLAGIVFSPDPPASADPAAHAGAALPIWPYVAESARRRPGRRVGLHPVTVFSTVALTGIGLCTAGMLLSGLQNARNVHAAQQAVDAIAAAADPAASLRSLLALQHQIERYAPRSGHSAPLSTRFGLNRNEAILSSLWRPYTEASRELLVAPIQRDLENILAGLSQAPVAGLDAEAIRSALGGHQTLKTYLMLAHPERVEQDFLAPELVRRWRTDAHIPPGERDDLAERLLRFYAGHLQAHPDWRIAARPELVAGARQTVLAAIGQRDAQDTLYRQIIDEIGGRYPDQTLVSLTAGTDARGLIRADTVVPGAYSRQAYEGHVADAIEAAVKRPRPAPDWVLGDAQAEQPATPFDLRAALAARYFGDYADHWQRFMNSLRWKPAPTMPAAIGQLKLMADARQSPVLALMKSLAYQGGAGARTASLSDTLVTKAQDMLGRKITAPLAESPDNAGPLGPAFGPIMRLAALGHEASGTDELSLQRFLDRATALRLRLQQVSHSPDADAEARRMAQALFRDKGSELADTQAHAQRIAASLGAEWAGMGEALFVRPIAQATQSVLRPAQASLNAAWRDRIAMAWGRSFAGRYPFADTANDASWPELARFLRPQGGLIHAFLSAELAGVLELQGDQWKPVAAGGQSLAIDPAFLAAINRLQHIGARLLAHGEPRYRFELKPVPTPGLTDTRLTLDGQTLHYYNQREVWQAMAWPAATPGYPGTRLQWQTEAAGTNQHYAFGGRWGWVRMLERASVEPMDSATFQLTWHAEPGDHGSTPAPDPDSLTARAAMLAPSRDVTHPIRYLLRTELGQGPLELLALRGFAMPSRIFVDPRPIMTGRES